MMSLLLAVNTTAAKGEKDSSFCTFFDIPFIVSLILFIIGCFILLAVIVSINEKIGTISAVVIALSYLGLVIGEFQAGHIAHGIIMIGVFVVPVALLIILGTKESSKNTTEEDPKKIDDTSNSNNQR